VQRNRPPRNKTPSREGAAPAPAKIRVLPFFKALLLSWY
jgi:hypothetical protein